MRPIQRSVPIALLFCLLSPLWSELFWQTGVVNQLGFGTSSYFLDANNGTNGVQSLLEFPLDALYLGFEAGVAPADGSWQLNGSLLTNVTPPASLMLDYDWFYLVGTVPIPFSYTESNLDYSSLDLRLNGDYRLYKRQSLSLYLQGGYRLLYADQLITDYEGWQYRDEIAPADQYELYRIESNQDAIDYWILYHIVHLGVNLEAEISRRLEFSLSAAPALGLFFDRDDHLLRYKLSTGRGAGYGFQGEINLTYTFDSTESGWRPYLSLNGGYSWFFSPGVQRQYWYQDSDEPEGTEIENIVHDVTLIDPRIGITIGISGAP